MTASNIIIVAGFGSGISRSVAVRFGKRGYKVALLARTQARLDEAAQELNNDHNIDAKGFAVDLCDVAATIATIASVKAAFGPDSKIKILHWNAYAGGKPLLNANIDDISRGFNLSVTSLWLTIQAVVDDLEETKGAILVTGGALAMEHEMAVQVAVTYGAATLAVTKAAQRKLVHIAHETLKPKGIYVGEVNVQGFVKRTAADVHGNATIEADDVADLFVSMESSRDKVFESIS